MAKKVTKALLTEIQAAVSEKTKVETELSKLGLSVANMLILVQNKSADLEEANKAISEIQGKIQEKYGNVSVQVESGEITENEE